MARAAGTKGTAAKAPAKETASRQNMLVWWGGLGCGGVLVLSPGSAFLLVSLLIPAVLVAFIPEEGKTGRVVRTALLFGLAASVQPLRDYWERGGTMPDALAMVHRPSILFVTWTAIAAGWFICEFSGAVLRLVAEYNAATKRRRLTASLAMLEEEWGPLHPPT